MNKQTRLSIALVVLALVCGNALGQDRGPRTVTGAIDEIDTEASILVITERAIEFDDNLVVRDRTGKVLAEGRKALQVGQQVRCQETLEEGRPFAKEVWILGMSEQQPGGTSR